MQAKRLRAAWNNGHRANSMTYNFRYYSYQNEDFLKQCQIVNDEYCKVSVCS
jgi:hypothetical protein